MIAADIDLNTFECCANSRQFWRATISEEVKRADITRNDHSVDKRARRKARTGYIAVTILFVCNNCSRDCHSRLGLHSHF
jgi:hypothetical protein